MARILTPVAVDLDLAPTTYARRQVVELPTITRTSDADGLVLEARRGSVRGLWHDRAGQYHGWRARLNLTEDGVFATGDDSRHIRTPVVAASKLRAWTAIELWFREDELAADGTRRPDRPENGLVEGSSPTGTVRFRLWDGTNELWWNAVNGAWETFVTDSTDRNTAQEVQDNFPVLPETVRTLAVVAYVDTSDEDVTPFFYGARVLYQARLVGGADDAVLRTFLRSLRSELTARKTLQWDTTAETSTVQVPPTEVSIPSSKVVEVAAAFNLTDDPDEETNLTGTLAGGTFTFDSAIPASKRVLLEYTYRPDVVWVRHRDAVEIKRLPSLVLFQDSPVVIHEPEPEVLVRDVYAAVPTAVGVSPPARTGADFEIRIVGEFWRDVDELGRRLSSWFGGSGYRLLLSTESGLLVEVRWLEELQNVSGTLAAGPVELRGSVRLSYAVPRRDTTSARYLVRTAGVVTTTTSERFS